MPTYVCSAATGRLTPTQKAEIVRSITAIHHEENRNDGVTQVFLPVTQRLVGYRDLRTILLSWSGSHHAASIWRTRCAGGMAALARVEATINISCRRRPCPPGDRSGSHREIGIHKILVLKWVNIQ